MERDPIVESLHPDSGLSATARRIAQFIHANRALTLASSAADLAQRLDTSDATIIRSIQAMGFESLAEMRQTLVASLSPASNPATALTRTIRDIGSDLPDAIGAILGTHVEMIAALQNPAAQERIVNAVRCLYPARRVAIFGIGPSTGLADYLCRVLNRNGRSSFVIGTTGRAFADDLVSLREGDGLVVMAYGTLYREIAVLFQEASRLGLPTVLVTDRIQAENVPPGTAIVSAMRGREEHIALHSATVAILESIAFGLSVADREQTVDALDRLNRFRSRIEYF
ncbi:MurR/RpiR family transcriptional regulator [Nguyenibacter vanlangensis]|uniref:MurR/RpiR family transcriptional regulator n=1 Tax=Nguyenibacter vanlangensis TaxID=1216886 RepID=A0ABZ3D7S2_9PROT